MAIDRTAGARRSKSTSLDLRRSCNRSRDLTKTPLVHNRPDGVQEPYRLQSCKVFDLEATEGLELPALRYGAAAGGEELLPRLEEAARKLSVTLDYEEIQKPGVEGYSTGGRIVVRQSLSVPAKCGVIVHELCHEDLHQGENRAEAKTKTRSQRELEAEATAYVVMRHFGIEHVASNYLATYNVDGEQLLNSLETISGAAKRLITVVENTETNAEATATVASPESEVDLVPV